jgi:histidine ammonia-lyase
MPPRKPPRRASGSRTGRPIALNGERLTLEQVRDVARGQHCSLTSQARRRIRASRKIVDRAIASGDQVYGLNTGFGHLARVRIDEDQLDRLQLNLIRSHCAGVGEPLPEPVVRAILALRVNCLARGHSGIRQETLDQLLAMLEFGIHPVVPEHGSVGASGDLAPLAHLALATIGEGEVFFRGKRMAASLALKRAGLTPLKLRAREGLALINGTQVMSALGILALLDAEHLCAMADIIGAMSVEGLKGSHHAFDKRIHAARPHPGQIASARNLRRLLEDSPIEASHRNCGRVQDSYSLRCMAQVHGAVRDALAYVRRTLEIEVNSSTDNPMIFIEQGEFVSGGNFHGQPVSLCLDQLTTAGCSLANLSERRLERLVNPEHSGLTAFLARDPGLNSGFMIAQVTAAAMAAECRLLAHPASVDTIPTSANIEDHVSMGVHAARKARRAVDHIATVLAIELLCAAQALDYRRPLRASRGVEAARRTTRRRIARLEDDRVLTDDIERARELVLGDRLREAVEREVGALS